MTTYNCDTYTLQCGLVSHCPGILGFAFDCLEGICKCRKLMLLFSHMRTVSACRLPKYYA